MPPSTDSNRRPARRLPVAALALALTLSTSAALAQNDYRSVPGQDFAVLRNNPDAVIHFRGLHLRDAQTDPAKNEIILHFDGQADRDVFDRLVPALPDWVAMAYSGYDSAVIRAERPATFMTRSDRDGFDLRIVARDSAATNGVRLRGQIDSGDGNVELAGMQQENPRDAFALRGADYERGWRAGAVVVALRQKPLAMAQGIETGPVAPQHDSSLSMSGQWRKPSHGRIVEAGLEGGVPVGGGLKLIGSVQDVDAKGNSVRRLDGTAPKLAENTISAATGLAYDVAGLYGAGEMRGEALWGKAGWGGRLAYGERMRDGNWDASVTYHAPYDDTLEAVAARGRRSQVQIGFSHRLARELWGQATLRATRYGVEGDNHVAQTAGASASLRYLTDLGGIWGGLTYEFNGDYVLDSHKYQGAAPAPFTPLDIRTYEVHALSGSLSTELLDGLWADAYGGYAIDRYGPDGYFGGGDLRYALAPGWALTLGGGHSQVSTRQGERGAQTSASLKLIFDWGDSAPQAAPVSRAYFSSL